MYAKDDPHRAKSVTVTTRCREAPGKQSKSSHERTSTQCFYCPNPRAFNTFSSAIHRFTDLTGFKPQEAVHQNLHIVNYYALLNQKGHPTD